MAKPRLLLIGGKAFNVPAELRTYFDIARHIEQEDKKFATMPTVDYILVLTNWVNHGAIASARKSLPKTPIIWVRKGWPAMSAELQRRGLIQAPAAPPEIPEEVIAEVAEAPPVPDDPFASMTDEQLEAATRPEVTVPVQETTVPQTATPAAPAAPGAEINTPYPDGLKDANAGWQAQVMKFCAENCPDLGIDPMKAVDFFSVALHEELGPPDLKAQFDLSDEAAHGLYISFGKSRGQYRVKFGLPPIHTRAKIARPRATPPPPVPAPVPSEVDRMLQEYMRLTAEKSKLLEEQHVLEDKIVGVNKQLEIMKPFAEHFKGLAVAAKKVREALEQQGRKTT